MRRKGEFEMSMISQLVERLKKYAEQYDFLPLGREIRGTKELLRQAADTIETLSARLQAVNMERSSDYYEGERKLIDEMAEEIENCYGRETELSKRAREYLSKKELYHP